MNRTLKISILAVLTAVVAGCSSVPIKSYFHLTQPAGPAAAAAAVGKTVYVEPVDVDPFYNDYRIVYRMSPYELRYYTRDFWVTKPSIMFMSAVVDSMAATRGASGLSTVVDRAGADLILKMKIRVIEEVDGPVKWQARLAMDIEFQDAVSGEGLVRHSFDRSVDMKEKKVQALAPALSGIFFEELAKAEAGLGAKLGPQGRG